ncbi:MAG: exodeoxyribonuclease VII small subunit [Ruminococcus sp.]|nr:exodeoxyribonuclease VII small subunit [Ruminococcus sp.]
MKTEKMTFEQADAKLAQAVAQLESGTLSLDESVKVYTQACNYLIYCKNELENHKGQIQNINEKLMSTGGDLVED